MLLKHLIEAGADIEATDEEGCTPLFYAVESETKSVEKTKLLLSAGAQANATQEIGYTPLFYATQSRSCEKLLDLLLDYGADVNFSGMNGYTPIIEMVSFRKATAKRLKALMERGANLNAQEEEFGFSCLHLAIANDDLKSAKLLIDLGIDLELKDKRGRTPLTCSVLGSELKQKVFRLLLESGADVNAKDNERYSVLHFAVMLNDEGTIRMLLKAGADLNATTIKGETVFDMVALRGGGPEDFATISEILSSFEK